jgi:hypothetical protein
VTRARVCSFSGMRPGPGCLFPVTELFVAGTEPTRECTYHQEHSPWHRLDTAYAGWLQERHEHGAEGRYRLAGFDPDLNRVFRPGFEAPGSYRPEAALSTPPFPAKRGGVSYPRAAVLRAGSRVSIVYPLAGDRFLMAPQAEAVEITLKAMGRAPVKQVSWFVNGREVGTVGPPYQLSVPLPRGRHTLTALGLDGTGDTVEVSVQ